MGQYLALLCLLSLVTSKPRVGLASCTACTAPLGVPILLLEWAATPESWSASIPLKLATKLSRSSLFLHLHDDKPSLQNAPFFFQNLQGWLCLRMRVFPYAMYLPFPSTKELHPPPNQTRMNRISDYSDQIVPTFTKLEDRTTTIHGPHC